MSKVVDAKFFDLDSANKIMLCSCSKTITKVENVGPKVKEKRETLFAVETCPNRAYSHFRHKRYRKSICNDFSGCLPSISIYNWVQGLCIGPDVSHTVDKSDCKTEGNGVGDFEVPPVITKGFAQVKEILECAENNTVLISFDICLSSDVTFTWETMLVKKNLFVELPSEILPHSSKESFVTLLEYAEDYLKCSHVIVCFKKDHQHRPFLLKVCMFLGFQLLPPGHPLIPSASGDIMYLAYIRGDDEDEDIID